MAKEQHWKWTDCSYMLEMKPRHDDASLFVDCPLIGQQTHKNELVKIFTDRIEIGPSETETREIDHESKGRCQGLISGVRLCADTVQGIAWADDDRVFTCKLGTDQQLEPKTFTQIARDCCNTDVSLDSFVADANGVHLQAVCSICQEQFFKSNCISQCRALPCDDWQSALDSVDLFCHHHPDSAGDNTGSEPGSFLPDQGHCHVADSYLLVHKDDTQSLKVNSETKAVHCEHCLADVGMLCRVHNGVYQLYHAAAQLHKECDINIGLSSWLTHRYQSMERYFAWTLATNCETHSSLKFLLRSFEKRAHLLIWLLDSYSVFVFGKMCALPTSSVSEQPVSALKLMYKLYDETTAKNDPRASGHDASVTIVSLPNAACRDLQQLLMESTQSLPPVCRTIGQFYVGYLRTG